MYECTTTLCFSLTHEKQNIISFIINSFHQDPTYLIPPTSLFNRLKGKKGKIINKENKNPKIIKIQTIDPNYCRLFHPISRMDNLNSQFLNTAKIGDLRLIKRLVGEFADINCVDAKGGSAIFSSCISPTTNVLSIYCLWKLILN